MRYVVPEGWTEEPWREETERKGSTSATPSTQRKTACRSTAWTRRRWMPSWQKRKKARVRSLTNVGTMQCADQA